MEYEARVAELRVAYKEGKRAAWERFRTERDALLRKLAKSRAHEIMVGPGATSQFDGPENGGDGG